MSKTYRSWAPRQAFLLPPSPLEWLPEGHLAYFVLDVVETIDLSEIEDAIAAKDPRGERPYAPKMMLALLVYGYCVGVFSSRKLARATFDDVAFRVLAAGSHPHFTRINQFRLDHLERLAGLFIQVLRLCERAGLVQLGHVALDGTKILANASKHKAMSYKRMQEEEARLKAEVQALLARADETDRTEDERFGVGCAPEDLPAELQRRESRLDRIAKAKAELEREAAQARAETLRRNAEGQRERAGDPSVDETERRRAATRARKSEDEASRLDDDDQGPSAGSDDLPHHRVPTKADGTPKPEAQRNFTDPDSRIMVKGGTFVQAYNAQIAVDEGAQVIVAQALTNQPPDIQHLRPLVDRIAANLGQLPERMTADAGYYTDANVEYCVERGIDPFISVGRQHHRSGDTSRTACASTEAAEKMRQKLQTERGRATYARRKATAEPPFGQIQEARRFRRFSLRGLAKASCEWAWVCLTHNLLKLFRRAPSAVLQLS